MVRRRIATVEPSDGLTLTPADLYLQRHHQPARRLVAFVVDTSDSMGDGPTARMRAALGALLSLAGSAYLNRDQVCLITFREHTADLVVPPTDSVMLIRQRVQRLPVGGATPLAAGLNKACRVMRQARAKNPGLIPVMVLISDGEATASLEPGADPQRECLELAGALRRENFTSFVIDTSIEPQSRRLMPRLAEALGTDCHHLHSLQAAQVLTLVNRAAGED